MTLEFNMSGDASSLEFMFCSVCRREIIKSFEWKFCAYCGEKL